MRTPSPTPALAALALGGFGIGTAEFTAMGLLPDVARDFGASIPATGATISGYALGVVIGAPLLAAAGARVERRRLLIALMALFTLGGLASAAAPTLEALVAARFATGLPHGTFFGVSSVVAAGLVPPARRAQAVALVMAGLAAANVVGVPLATWLGQHLGWRAAQLATAAIGVLAAAAVARWVPERRAEPGASVRSELGALRRLQVWLSLAVGAVGFGGMFAAYSYIAPTMTEVTGLPEAGVAPVLGVYGVGMVLGTLAGGRAADRALMPTLYGALAAIGCTLLLFSAAAPYPVPAIAAVFLLGFCGSALIPSLQMRLMNVSADAPSLAAALNHSALNFANAAGAALGGVVIAAGYGYTAPAVLGAGLAALGLAIAVTAGALSRRAPVPAA